MKRYKKISSIGLGTYKGESTQSVYKNWEDSIISFVLKGFNVIDRAAKYRNQRSKKKISKFIQILQKRQKYSERNPLYNYLYLKGINKLIILDIY